MAQNSNMAQNPNMGMASLHASLLAPKGAAQPAVTAPVLAPPGLSSPVSGRRIGNTGNPQQNSGARPSGQKTTDQKATDQKSTAQKSKNRRTKKKSVRLSTAMDKDLRLLAARNGQSQQALIEQAIGDYLDKAFASGECLCRR